ncbi:MAG: hypothetical protein EOM26_04455 [Alphaproteobacteria bacterium]|nr:hypothetical protein [Alphaproteobacteria bacterium]
MSVSLTCPVCVELFALADILKNATRSWPENRMVDFRCDKCGEETHVRLEDGYAEILAIVGAPGPATDTIETVSVPDLTIRADPGFLHVWFDGEHYAVPA